MNISNDVPIFKISNSVFQIGNIDYDIKFLDTIIALLTLGNKFVPNYFQKNVQFFHFLLLDIDLKFKILGDPYKIRLFENILPM